MNLQEMRERHFEEEFISLIDKYKFEVAQDQDYLNVLCHNSVHFVESDWNQMPFGPFNKNVKLIHFNLSYKPWKYEKVMYDDIFWNYAKRMNLDNDIIEMRNNFTPEMQRRDLEGGKRLLDLCVQEANNENNYYHQFVEFGENNLFDGIANKIANLLKKA